MSDISHLAEKRDMILANERRQAAVVATDVIDKPKLSLWMILIPVFFVFYFYQLKRYSNGLKDFSANFLKTRERTLDAVFAATIEDTEVDIERLVTVSDTPETVKGQYRNWVDTLTNHFQRLLLAEGCSFTELVRSSHKTKANYLLLLNRLNVAEREFHSSLTAHLPRDDSTISSIIQAMETSAEQFRRKQADDIFR